MQAALIVREDEYRFAPWITDTALANHQRHGWTIVQRWSKTPSSQTVTETVWIHAHGYAL